jgi:cell division protein FtsW
MNIALNAYKNLKGDKTIWVIVALLAMFSILAVYSATGTIAYQYKGGNTEVYLVKHILIISMGMALTYFCYRLLYMQYSKLAPLLLMIAIPLLAYTLFFGTEINDAKRWISLPGIGLTFQTSDFAKLALIIYVARAISTKQDIIKDFNSAFLPIIVPVLIICGLIAPADLSTSLMLFATCLLMMFIGRVDMKYIGLLVLMGIVVFSLLIAIGTFFPEFVRVETWIARVNEFFGNTDGGYQIQQAKIAIADGGFIGVGPGNSIQRNFLPSPYADFIYSIICEEYGLLGGFTIIFLYLLLFFRCTSIVTRSPKAFGAMLAMGLCLSIIIQAFANIAVSLHLVPVTGLTLPLVSMGGTSFLFSCISFGIILSVSRYIEQATQEAGHVEIRTIHESDH